MQGDNCVYGGGSCTASDATDPDVAVTDRTIALIVVYVFVGIFFSVIVICCFSKRCPLFGDCERSRGLRKKR